jgi:hypothetical protein
MEYISIGEYNWLRLIDVELTEEQSMLLSLKNKERSQELIDLINYINENNKVVLNETELAELVSLYETLKPASETGYEFIDMNVTIENEISRGILNCRINNEHIQIRF